jgi:hypothetical protein
VYVFIWVSDHIYISIYVCTVLKKIITNESCPLIKSHLTGRCPIANGTSDGVSKTVRIFPAVSVDRK